MVNIELTHQCKIAINETIRTNSNTCITHLNMKLLTN